MTTRQLKIRNEKLNAPEMRRLMYRFFRETKFNSQYITIAPKILTYDSENPIYSVGDYTVLRLPEDKVEYVQLLGEHVKVKSKYFNSTKARKLIVYYKDSDISEYNSYINETIYSKKWYWFSFFHCS
uniref:hypothetical protein n=1 Tax=Porodaedalea niemelaei TaxID=175858 RepID=UPI0023AA362A|nr:hypothetical protein P1R16_mgp29 [Porodaedalea niemelaei]WCF76663.1 hypothetical protein [Porodaedalea niemelaei]